MIHPDNPEWADLSGDELRQARIHFLTHDAETGEDIGHLAVPGSRWGRNGAECAEVAADLTEIIQEATGEPDTAEGLEHDMSLVVNDHDDVGSLLWEYGTEEMREYYADELEDFRPREALSSGHCSVDGQLADVVASLDDDETARFLVEFPEWERVEWSGSWLDTEAMGVDVEWSSRAIDWIEANTPIQWEDGEPYRFDMSR